MIPAGTAAAAAGGTAPGWLAVGLVLGIVVGLLAGMFVGRRRTLGRRTAGAAPEPSAAPAGRAITAEPATVIDDLPRFREHPPGSPPAPRDDEAAVDGSAATTATAGATVAVATPSAAAGHLSDRTSLLAMVVAAVLLVVVAVVIALAGGDSSGSSARRRTEAARSPAPTTAPTDAPATATETATAAAALAFRSVPLGTDGLAASVTFEGVVLEQRAVGLTVTYPSLSVSTDGQQSLAHVRLPTFNCLTSEPPADPLAAGCVRSLTEYADLPSPALRVDRDGDQLDIAGLFPTYIRSNGSPPAYTGRAYQLTADISAAGPVRSRRAPAVGVLRIGLSSAPTTGDPGVNVLQFPG